MLYKGDRLIICSTPQQNVLNLIEILVKRALGPYPEQDWQMTGLHLTVCSNAFTPLLNGVKNAAKKPLLSH